MEGSSIRCIALWDCCYDCDIEVSLTAGKDYRDVNASLVKRNYRVFKGALSGMRQFLAIEKHFKNDEKCFLLHLKSSF